MTRPLADFCAAMAIDPPRARGVLVAGDAAERPLPWFVLAVIGVGGWITALLIAAFLAVALYLTMGAHSAGIPAAVVGFAAYIVAIALLRLRPGGAFRRQIANALAAAGAIMTALGVGIAYEEILPGAVVALAVAALNIWLARDPVLQFLVSGAAASWFGIWLIAEETPYLLDVLSVATVLGVLLYLRPPVHDTRPTALVLMLMVPVTAVMLDFNEWSFLLGNFQPGGWAARALNGLLFLALIWLFQRARGAKPLAVETVLFGAAALLISLLLPPGGSATLLLLMLAFVVGSRPLALIGIALEGYFLWRFYYDIQATLLEKSVLLAAVGVLLLALYARWELSARRRIAP
jgi:hypothetical protein